MTEDNNNYSGLDTALMLGRSILKDNLDLNTRTIYFTGNITPRSADRLIKSIHYLSGLHEDPITIQITSGGGDVYSGLAIIDAINTAKCDIYIRAIGLNASMAIPIIASGRQRIATENAIFMYHGASAGLPYDKLPSIESDIKHIKKLNSRLDRLMAKYTDKPYIFWNKIGKHMDHFFDAEEAMEYGLVDTIEKGVWADGDDS
jgi:ATP-dependent Clp protease protease subunit